MNILYTEIFYSLSIICSKRYRNGSKKDSTEIAFSSRSDIIEKHDEEKTFEKPLVKCLSHSETFGAAVADTSLLGICDDRANKKTKEDAISDSVEVSSQINVHSFTATNKDKRNRQLFTRKKNKNSLQSSGNTAKIINQKPTYVPKTFRLLKIFESRKSEDSSILSISESSENSTQLFHKNKSSSKYMPDSHPLRGDNLKYIIADKNTLADPNLNILKTNLSPNSYKTESSCSKISNKLQFGLEFKGTNKRMRLDISQELPPNANNYNISENRSCLCSNKPKKQKQTETSCGKNTIANKISHLCKKNVNERSNNTLPIYLSSKIINKKLLKEIIPKKFAKKIRKKSSNSKNITLKCLDKKCFEPNKRPIMHSDDLGNQKYNISALDPLKYDEYIEYISNLSLAEIQKIVALLKKNIHINPRKIKNSVENKKPILYYSNKIRNECEEIVTDISEEKIPRLNRQIDDIIYKTTNIDSFVDLLLNEMNKLGSLDLKDANSLNILFTTFQEIMGYEKNIYKKIQVDEILRHINFLDINHSLELIVKNSRYMMLPETFYILSLYDKDIKDFIKEQNLVHVSFLLRIFALHIIKILPNRKVQFKRKYIKKENLYRSQYFYKIFNLRKIMYNIFLGIKEFNSKANLYQLLNIFDFKQKIIYRNHIFEEYLLFRLQLNSMFILILCPEFKVQNNIFIRKVIAILGITCFSRSPDLKRLNSKLHRICNDRKNIPKILKSLCHTFLQKDMSFLNAPSSSSHSDTSDLEYKEILDFYSKTNGFISEPSKAEEDIFKFLFKLEFEIFKFLDIEKFGTEGFNGLEELLAKKYHDSNPCNSGFNE
ncbi:hypothetical protein CWI38_0525p0020 [Hamiltosporidium tvaerminnensis]|uniref:Uncharacterized protein n=1 Tax=Hamiltosporidium tvaerminnensis TaxID=1176355 RepID=A0A4Q9LXR2_9MICR|nr:hypothetical protein LUQ84_001980 [Hamiltosporidium tvaerminnensis]TBU02757.1 hypothetical protein CWI37_0420p0020 [Hamiltosporidium tvaerminnensis]TBU13117.1 hypothetical protein CWI38_0525p0020 [Hamiltosporidium tvaerminnensis]